MLYRLLGSLHVRLVLFVIIVMTPALALILFIGFEQRSQAAEAIKEDALRTTYIVTSYQEQLILSTHQLLKLLASLPAIADHEAEACSETFAAFSKQYAFYSGFAAADQNGNIFCDSSLEQLDGGTPNVADRDWFKRSVEIRKFVVSDVVVQASGRAVQTFGYPVYDERNTLQAVIVAGLDINYLNEFSTRAQLPEGSVITIFDSQGKILARYPDTDEWVGQTIPDHPMIKAVLAHKGDGTAEIIGLDGLPHLCAFTYLRFNEQGLYLNISVPAEAAFYDADRLLARNLGLFGIIVLVEVIVAAIAGVIFIVRPIRIMAQATQQLAEGDLTTTIDTTRNMGDLSVLATSFNNMVARLRQHEENLRLAEVRYRKLVEKVPTVIYTMNLESQSMTYLSPRFETMLGDRPERYLNDHQKWLDLIHPEDRVRYMRRVQHSAKTGHAQMLEYRVQQHDGSYIWVRDDGVVTSDDTKLVHELQGTMLDISERKEAEEIIQMQAETMRELSTPLLHISDKVALMPVIGALDTQRASQMMETLLKGVEVMGTKTVILDITGVSVVDTQVARAIIDIESSVRLLGARMMLTGVRPDVAQAIVGLGIDLHAILTHSTLQSGIGHVLRR